MTQRSWLIAERQWAQQISYGVPGSPVKIRQGRVSVLKELVHSENPCIRMALERTLCVGVMASGLCRGVGDSIEILLDTTDCSTGQVVQVIGESSSFFKLEGGKTLPKNQESVGWKWVDDVNDGEVSPPHIETAPIWKKTSARNVR